MHRKKRKQHVLMFLIAVTWLALAGTVTPVRSQHVICCNQLIDVNGNWVGAWRDCKAGLEQASPEIRAGACEEIRKAGCCPEVAALCGQISPKCKAAHEYGPPNPSASPSPDEPNEKACKADNVGVEVSRSSLVQTSSTGNPAPGANPAFKYTANPSSASTYTTSDASANPNSGDIKAPINPSATGEPSPGALAELTVSYTCEGGDTVTKKFSVATFGLSCYVLADENDWVLPAPAPTPTPSPTPMPSPTASPSPVPSPTEEASPTPTPTPTLNCKSMRIDGVRYSGVTKDPTGLPKGEYCTAFLRDVQLQGSGTTRDGTKIKHVSGVTQNTWVFKTVTVFTGADEKELIVNGSVARDRRIVGGKGDTTVTLESGSFKANDIGDAIKGYRLDVFGGTGRQACKNFKNRIEIGACDPGSDKCPELKSPIP